VAVGRGWQPNLNLERRSVSGALAIALRLRDVADGSSGVAPVPRGGGVAVAVDSAGSEHVTDDTRPRSACGPVRPPSRSQEHACG
jgi:hypothetical protein